MGDTKSGNSMNSGGCCGGAEQKKSEPKASGEQCCSTQTKAAPAKPAPAK